METRLSAAQAQQYGANRDGYKTTTKGGEKKKSGAPVVAASSRCSSLALIAAGNKTARLWRCNYLCGPVRFKYSICAATAARFAVTEGKLVKG